MGGFLVNCLKNVPLELWKCLVLTAWGVLKSSTFVVDLLQNQSESCIPTFSGMMALSSDNVKFFSCGRTIFSMAPSDFVPSSTLKALVFWRPIALTSSLATLLCCSRRKSLDILEAGPSLMPANRFHLNLCASLGVRRPSSEACTRRPARAYLLAPCNRKINVRNFHTPINLSPSPSFTESSAFRSSRPRLRWMQP